MVPKGGAYLPQNPGIVNRETSGTASALRPRELRGFSRRHAGLHAPFGPANWLRMRLDALRLQLRTYRPANAANATEAAFVDRMLELSRAEGACERAHFSPGHFTASAFVLSPGRTHLVLIHHKKLGIWVQPGGHVEPQDPDLMSAARREVLEEVGLAELEPLSGPDGSPIFDVDIHQIPARKADPAHEHFDVRFAFVAKSQALVHSEEVADLRWVWLADVERMGTDESVLRAVNKLRALER